MQSFKLVNQGAHSMRNTRRGAKSFSGKTFDADVQNGQVPLTLWLEVTDRRLQEADNQELILRRCFSPFNPPSEDLRKAICAHLEERFKRTCEIVMGDVEQTAMLSLQSWAEKHGLLSGEPE